MLGLQNYATDSGDYGGTNTYGSDNRDSGNANRWLFAVRTWRL